MYTMEGFSFEFAARKMALWALVLTLLSAPAYGQIASPCTTAMVTSFMPCITFITGGNGSSPTAACCSALKSLTGASSDCACSLLAGNVPSQIPINRTLAVSLPTNCNSSAVPLQCKVGAAPAPAPGPGPGSFGPSPLSSAMSPSETPIASPVSPTLEPDTPSTLTPAATPTGTTSPDIRPTVTQPNSAASLWTFSSGSVLLSIILILIVNYC